MQTLSSVAPPPIEPESIDATYDVTTFIPAAPEQPQRLRMVGWVMVIGGAVALALVLIMPKLRSAPALPMAVPTPPALPAAPQEAAEVREAPAAKVESAPTMKGRRGKRAAPVAAAVETMDTNIRIRARVAPVRAAPEADAKVVCSVKRGAVMHSYQQMQSGKARWFGVHCAKDSPGWVHENFLTPIKP